MRHLAIFLPLVLIAGGRAPRQWWEVVRADIEQFRRPIMDRHAASKEGDKPLVRGGRAFCPHTDRSPLRTHYLSDPPNPRMMDQLI